jgi:hypothetical protein
MNHPSLTRPSDREYAPFYKRYVAAVESADVFAVLEQQIEDLRNLAGGLTPERETFRYAEGKWSLREVLGHIADAERVFGYRLFCIARGEQRSLPAFDEDDYVRNGNANERSASKLSEEFALVRRANLDLMHSLDDAAWTRVGIANDAEVSVRALAFILAGHASHHLQILRDRYEANF